MCGIEPVDNAVLDIPESQGSIGDDVMTDGSGYEGMPSGLEARYAGDYRSEGQGASNVDLAQGRMGGVETETTATPTGGGDASVGDPSGRPPAKSASAMSTDELLDMQDDMHKGSEDASLLTNIASMRHQTAMGIIQNMR